MRPCLPRCIGASLPAIHAVLGPGGRIPPKALGEGFPGAAGSPLGARPTPGPRALRTLSTPGTHAAGPGAQLAQQSAQSVLSSPVSPWLCPLPQAPHHEVQDERIRMAFEETTVLPSLGSGSGPAAAGGRAGRGGGRAGHKGGGSWPVGGRAAGEAWGREPGQVRMAGRQFDEGHRQARGSCSRLLALGLVIVVPSLCLQAPPAWLLRTAARAAAPCGGGAPRGGAAPGRAAPPPRRSWAGAAAPKWMQWQQSWAGGWRSAAAGRTPLPQRAQRDAALARPSLDLAAALVWA